MKEMSGKDLLECTGNRMQYLVINYNGKESGKSIHKSYTTERVDPKGQGHEMISKIRSLPSRSIVFWGRQVWPDAARAAEFRHCGGHGGQVG